jgi:hypothetical protein
MKKENWLPIAAGVGLVGGLAYLLTRRSQSRQPTLPGTLGAYGQNAGMYGTPGYGAPGYPGGPGYPGAQQPGGGLAGAIASALPGVFGAIPGIISAARGPSGPGAPPPSPYTQPPSGGFVGPSPDSGDGGGVFVPMPDSGGGGDFVGPPVPTDQGGDFVGPPVPPDYVPPPPPDPGAIDPMTIDESGPTGPEWFGI